MFIGILLHYCPCGGEFAISSVAITEEKSLRCFGVCGVCDHEVFADTTLADLFRYALQLKAKHLEQDCQKLLPPPNLEAADNEWLHSLGIGGNDAIPQ